jgi:8-oxo-dGTP diphosphatase
MDEKTYDVSKYDKPSVTTDIVIFTISNKTIRVLLVKRGEWPFKGELALPGGFVRMNENILDTAKRELKEETGVHDIYLEQLYTFGDVGRDPRTRVITIAYLALVDSTKIILNATTDVTQALWVDVSKLPKLAFDHNKLIEYAVERLKAKLSYSNIALSLLPENFTLTQLQEAYEVILGHKIDKRNFRKKISSLNFVKETKMILRGRPTRPAKLYTATDKNFRLKIFD